MEQVTSVRQGGSGRSTLSLITLLRHVWSASLDVSGSQCRPGTVYPPYSPSRCSVEGSGIWWDCIVHRCDEVGTDMFCLRTYIPSTWSAVCVFSPSRMAERMASLHESAVRMMAPFLLKMATLSLAPVVPLELSSPLSEYMSSFIPGTRTVGSFSRPRRP